MTVVQEAQFTGIRLDPAVYDRNLKSLISVDFSTAELIQSTPLPNGLMPLAGRDGAATFAWPDSNSNNLPWLGRTTMPNVRAPALINIFNPGVGNVLLHSSGQGREIYLLLQRLSRHQAIMVIEPMPWVIALVLRLHDFSEAMARRRLLFFVGPESWEKLRDFLLAHDGFLSPDRVLAWPWFTQSVISETTDRLAAIHSAVAQSRAEKAAQYDHAIAAGPRQTATPSIAIISNRCDGPVRTMADRINAGATQLDWPCKQFILDDPSCVHPTAVERAIHDANPSVLILLDVLPTGLSHGLPQRQIFILCTHKESLAENWLHEMPTTAKLGVLTDAQMQEAEAAGVPVANVMLVRPAALPNLIDTSRAQSSRNRILVLADGGDSSAEAAGLRLTTHVRLWNAAEKIIAQRIDDYRDEHADDVLSRSEQSAQIKLESDEVRHGLADRIRRRLGPLLLRRLYCEALIEADIPFDLYGSAWPQSSPSLIAHHRGPWPLSDKLPALLASYGAVIVIEPSVSDGMMDSLAAGLVGFARGNRDHAQDDGCRNVLGDLPALMTYNDRRSLISSLRKFQSNPSACVTQTTATSQQLSREHTWTQRLREITEFCTQSEP